MSFFSISASSGRDIYRNGHRGSGYYRKRGILNNLFDIIASRSGPAYYYDGYPNQYPPPYPNQSASPAAGAVCGACGSQIPAGSKFCLNCGNAVAAAAPPHEERQAQFCPNCGDKTLPNARFCPKCGIKLNH